MEKRAKGIIHLTVVLFLLFSVVACSKSKAGAGGGGGGSVAPTSSLEAADVSLSITIPKEIGLSKALLAPAPTSVQSIQVTVTGPVGFTTIIKTMNKGTDFLATADPVIVSISVPIGSDRTFTAKAFDAAGATGNILYQGSTVGVTLASGPNKIDLFLFVPPFSAPAITSFTPTVACGGDSITLTGSNFDPIAANNTVLFNGSSEYGTITSASATTITVTVPSDNAAGTIKVTNLLGGSANSADSLTGSGCSKSTLLFGTKRNLSSTLTSSTVPGVATSAGRAVVTYVDTGTGGVSDIFVLTSTDNGATFGTPKNVSNSGVNSLDPAIAISGLNVVVVWEETNDIFYAISTDGGANFGAVANLSNNTGPSVDPAVAISGSTIIVSWGDETGLTVPDILFAKSTNIGTSFGGTVNVSNNASIGSYASAIAFSFNAYVVTWQDKEPAGANFDIFVSRSTNSGTSFLPVQNISGSIAEDSMAPSIASVSSDQTVLISWQEELLNGLGEIYLAKSSDDGTTFSPKLNISSRTTDSDSRNSSVTLSGTTALVSWEDSSPANYDIFLARSTDGGSSFSPNAGTPVVPKVNFSGTPGISSASSVALSGTFILTTWQDNTLGNNDILLSRSE
jgi:hypothetical protein